MLKSLLLRIGTLAARVSILKGSPLSCTKTVLTVDQSLFRGQKSSLPTFPLQVVLPAVSAGGLMSHSLGAH